MSTKSKIINMSVYVGLALLLLLLCSGAAPAKDVKFPTPSYEGQELNQVREWEKTWVGKKVTSSDIDQVKDLLPESIYTIMKNPKDFGAEGDLWFTVVPYREYKVSPGLIESTKQYAPQSRLDANLVLENYGKVAGIPFPQLDTSDPVVAGTQAAWNFDGYTHGDGIYVFNGPAAIIDSRTRLERSAGHFRWELYWSGRSDVAPKPELPKNDRKVQRTFFQRNTAPPDFADTTVLEVKYQDTSRDCDLYVYTAMFRRIRRYSTNQRTDMIDGTDMIYDDNHGWYTHININKYKLIGQKDLLVSRHAEDPKTNCTRITGQAFWNGVQRERTKCWVVEAINKDPDYIYSKRVWYLDPENWQMNVQEMYDRQGRLWKLLEFFYNEYKMVEAEGMTTHVATEQIVDLVRRHGSLAYYEVHKLGTSLDTKIFSVANLQQLSY